MKLKIILEKSKENYKEISLDGIQDVDSFEQILKRAELLARDSFEVEKFFNRSEISPLNRKHGDKCSKLPCGLCSGL